MAEMLTPQQKMAVENRGGKLLVSAAAGSGKTKVLVDRLMKYAFCFIQYFFTKGFILTNES